MDVRGHKGKKIQKSRHLRIEGLWEWCKGRGWPSLCRLEAGGGVGVTGGSRHLCYWEGLACALTLRGPSVRSQQMLLSGGPEDAYAEGELRTRAFLECWGLNKGECMSGWDGGTVSYDRLHLICVELIARIWVPAVAKACLQMTKLPSLGQPVKILISRSHYNVGFQKNFF